MDESGGDKEMEGKKEVERRGGNKEVERRGGHKEVDGCGGNKKDGGKWKGTQSQVRQRA